jgi:hypothetical protein
MIVSEAKKSIFVHIPKCAGTSFRNTIQHLHDYPKKTFGVQQTDYFHQQLDHHHLRLWEVAAIYPDIFQKLKFYHSLVFVRNRYERLLSSIHEHHKKYRGQVISTRSPAEQVEICEKTVKSLTIRNILSDKAYVHFSPQHWYIMLGEERIVQHIIPMRKGSNFIGDALKILGSPNLPQKELNKGKMAVGTLLESPVIRAFVEDIYGRDAVLFESLGFHDLAILPASHVPPKAATPAPVAKLVWSRHSSSTPLRARDALEAHWPGF